MTAIVLFILGILFSWSGWRLIKKMRSIHQWNRVEAVFTKKGAKLTDKATGGSRSARHELDLVYEYVVDGVTFTGTRYSEVTTLSSEKSTLEKAQQLPDRAPIFVNPNAPDEAVVKAPSLILAYAVTATGLSFVIASFILLFATII